MNDDSRWNRTRRSEPIMLVALFLLATVAFTAVSALSNSFHARQRGVTRELSARAAAEMKSGDFQGAARSYRAALDLAPDNFSYQLGLAEALMASKRDQEALAYLQILWEREPQNGKVNLDLARNYAARGDNDRAIRHYQNAIYAVWETDADGNRRAVRLELVHYLLNLRATTQAEAELVALAGNLPEDATLRNQVAALFVEIGDYSRALSQYQRVLGVDRRNQDALEGAGHAAFLAGQYATAKRYLQEAIRKDPKNSTLTDLLNTADLVLDSDPYSRRVSDSERRARVVDAFRIAARRLHDCTAQPAHSPEAQQELQVLSQRQNTVQAKVNDRTLRRDQELANIVMDLVFAIEKRTEETCGPPSGKDLALLLISKDRGDAEQ